MTLQKTALLLLSLVCLFFCCQNQEESNQEESETTPKGMTTETSEKSPPLPEPELAQINLSDSPSDTLIAEELFQQSKEYYHQGRLRAAFERTSKALDIFEKFPTVKKDNAIKCKLLLSSILLANQKIQPSYSLASEVHQFYKNQEPSVEKGNSYQILAGLFLQVGMLDTATHYINLAEEVFLKIPNLDPFIFASFNQAKGSVYYLNGQLRNALNAMNKAKAVLEKSKAERPFLLMVTYKSLAAVYASLEEFEKASTYLDYDLHLLDHSDIDETFRPIILITYGNLLAMTPEYNKAIAKLKEAELLLEKDSLSEESLKASIYYGFGTAHYTAKNSEETIAAFQKAAEIWGRTIDPMYGGIANCYSYIADEEERRGNTALAKEWYGKALAIDTISIGKNYVDVVSFYRDLAKIEMKAGNNEKALSLVKEAYSCLLYNPDDPEFYRNYISPDGLLLTLQVESEIHLRNFYKDKAEENLVKSMAATDKAIRVFDHLMNNLASPSSIKYMFDATGNLFEIAIKQQVLATELYQQKPGQKAFDLFERAKDILILESYNQNNFFSGQFLKDSIFLKEKDAISAIEQLEQELFQRSLEPPIDSVAFRNVQTQLFEAKSQQDAYESAIREKYPKFAAVKYNHKTVNIKEVQDNLLHTNKALVEYFVGDSSIFVFTILKNKVDIHEIKKDFPLEKWTTDLLQAIADLANPKKDRRVAATLYATKAHQIYQKIVAPVTMLLPEEADLIIIPDGILGYLPFEALLTTPAEDALGFPNHHYLLKKHQISYAFSATLLAKKPFPKSKKEPLKNILAFAPSFHDDKVTVPNNTSDGVATYSLSPLAFNKSAVVDLKKKFTTDAFIDERATKDRFIQLAENYQIIHLATHGKANNIAGELAFLAFYPDSDSSKNILLYNRDIYKLKLNADLVILSACETGIGELQIGEGIISLARGFSYAGAKSVVTTLWNVNDKSSQIIMGYFYDYLKEGLTKDAALREAKRKYIANNMDTGGSPFYWAGIIPIGNMEPILLEEKSWWRSLFGI